MRDVEARKVAVDHGKRHELTGFRTLLCVAFALVLPAASASCSSCDIDCSGTASVQAEVAGRPEGTRVEICLDDDCQVVTTQDFGSGKPIAVREVADGELLPDERFRVTLTLLDDTGGAVGSSRDDTHSFSRGRCSCLVFGYRWTGSGFDEWT